MAALFAIFKGALGDIWDNLWTAVVCTMVWVVSLFLVLPAPPVTFGLFYLANRLAHGEIVDLADFWYGIRRYWKTATLWGLVNLAVLFLLYFNFQFTGQAGSSPAWQFAQGLYLTLIVFWLLLQLYALPFLFEQEKPALLEALRNAAVMVGRNTLFSLAFLLLLAVLLLLGTLLFLISVPAGGFFLASAANRAVLDRLAANSLSGA